MASSTELARASRSCLRLSRSRSRCLDMIAEDRGQKPEDRGQCSLASVLCPLSSGLSKSPRDVIFRLLHAGPGEHVVGGAALDQPALEEKGRSVRNPGGLLHVVGDNDDGVIAL